MPSLFVIQGRDQGKRFELKDRVVGVGRDPSNAIRLNDTEISRRHGELRRGEEGFRWVDLSSSNGSFVNSARVSEQLLRSGDRVQIGRTMMIFTETSTVPADGSDQRPVDIVAQDDAPRSRIVSAVGQQTGSNFFSSEGQELSPWLARARSNLQVMYRTALAVSHTMDIDQLLQRIMDLIFEWVEADRGCVMLLDRETDQFEPRVRRDRQQRDADERMAISRTILDYVRGKQEGVLTSDARDDDRWDPAASIVKMGVREAICVPMQGRYGVVGAIYIDTFTPPGDLLQQTRQKDRFTEEHLKLMVAIGHQAALAVEDTSYYSAMVQAERLAAMGQTIAGLSHHIKNILQGIRGGSFLIEEGLKAQDWDVTQKGWAIVEKNQDRISSLVMDMLTFSKEREPEMLPSDLNEVVGDVLELMQTRAREHEVALVDQRAESIPVMTFDPEGIHRAILNLITNAIDACVSREVACVEEDDQDFDMAWSEEPVDEAAADDLAAGEGEGDTLSDTLVATPDSRLEPPHVVVRTSYDANASKLVVEVEDNGPGMSAAQARRIFNVFVSSKGQRGTGLGLPVSQKIVEEHGGQIRVESTPGKGSCFILEIPANSADVTGEFSSPQSDSMQAQVKGREP